MNKTLFFAACASHKWRSQSPNLFSFFNPLPKGKLPAPMKIGGKG